MFIIPKTLEQFYVLLLYIIGIIELILMTIAVINIEVIEKVWTLNISMTILFALLILIFIRYLFIVIAKTAHETSKQYSHSQELVYNMFEETISEVSKNYTLIDEMLENEQYSNARKYLNNILDLKDEHTFITEIHNPALSYLLSVKFYDAYKRGVTVNCDITSKSQLASFNTKDLVAIVGNLLDNAIKASEHSENKQITFRWYTIDKEDVLIFENCYLKSEDVSISCWFELGYTTNKDKKRGNGLAIVKKLVEKHNGTIIGQAKDNHVQFTVTLKNP
ncbi:GHKL domain-containing protein [Brevibacillus gelatini]|uniref:GHKL domain-containing protein n=1 Tax=Brevibacillus gelatini TaxID=1655277 RepID=A0A3M8B7U4_9BACL|nr:GHKL domain-containing protein [Brevibacillus gelatini]RNB59449.1 GHKL domain-containing protein [Brevibacillus gelatini]